MLRTTTLALTAFILAAGAAPALACSGPDAAITGVAVKMHATSGMVTKYTIVGTVSNLGTQAQAGNILQSVDIYLGDQKLDTRSIPPLSPGQSATFSYVWPRAIDAGNGSTVVNFKLDGQGPDCNPENDHYSITF